MRLIAAVILGVCASSASGQSICASGDGNWVEQVCLTREGSTPEYGHSILGPTPEWNALTVFYGDAAAPDGNRTSNTILPEDAAMGIFEDVAPRLVDVTGDGRPEAIVVETSPTVGARISVYAFGPEPYLLAATPPVGQRNRWYSPVGAADLDGDGAVEIAFVDRPHLAKVLRIFRYADGALTEIAQAAGVTNHRIGEADIAGGIRSCGGRPEMIVASADWSRLLAVRFENGGLLARDIGAHQGRDSFVVAMECG